ncbi:hypothetical protein [Subtercola lobariae]|uniref:Uncharacterized protein n=1 Tax=Subtercola lobariae TaxID=1588641 RepID=A0A917BHE4_9MICO|nr:hypothetical protein [Subtercola lobariae]GGF41505.1 hypothetical protein GCM10011399_37730 [Subtercola lobariae]
MNDETYELIQLDSTKWLLRKSGAGITLEIAGFIHFHHGRYEVLLLDVELTHAYFNSRQEALQHLTASRTVSTLVSPNN